MKNIAHTISIVLPQIININMFDARFEWFALYMFINYILLLIYIKNEPNHFPQKRKNLEQAQANNVQWRK